MAGLFCWSCGKEAPEGARFCPGCGAPIDGPCGAPCRSSAVDPSVLMLFNKKSEILALIMSLVIPGLGHLYIGQTNRGVLLFVAAVACAVLMLASVLLVVAYFVVCIYAMYDFYRLAKQYNRHLLERDGQPPLVRGARGPRRRPA